MKTTVFGAAPASGEDFLLVGEGVAQDHPGRREIPEYELVALLGDRRRRGDIDDERNAFLLGDLGDGGGLAGIEGADQELRAFADQLLGAGARGVDVRFGVGVHDREVGQTQRLQDRRSDVDAALAILPDAGLQAGARQQHADFQRAALGAQYGRRGKRGGGRGSAGEHMTAVGQHASAGHGVLLRDFYGILRGRYTWRQRRSGLKKVGNRCGNAQQPAVVAVARDEHEPDRQRGRKRQRHPQRSKKLPIEVLRSSAALRAAYIFASATSAIVGATIDDVGITRASKAASR